MASIRDLSHRLELIGVQRVDDGAGGWTRADTVDATVWAAIRPAKWHELREAERNEQRVSHIVTIRWRADLVGQAAQGARCRWKDRGGRLRELYIEAGVDPDEGGRWLALRCREGGPL
jgi:SPP1 family predicted phage head-tail adaptor